MAFALSAVVCMSASYQINSVFKTGDVRHLWKDRLPAVGTKYVHPGEIRLENIFQVPTKEPPFVFLCMRSPHIHFFLHDGHRFRLCVWSNSVSFDDKLCILSDLMSWLTDHEADYSLDYLLFDHEDAAVFKQASDSLKKPY